MGRYFNFFFEILYWKMLFFLFFLVCESTFLGSLVPSNETLPSNNLMKQIMTDPKKFVAEVSKVDPSELANIISLLEGLLETSEGYEQDLINKVDDETAKALQSAEDLVDAQGAVEDAQGAVEDAQAVVEDAKAALEQREQEEQAASAAHNAQEQAKAVAVQEHADLEGGLNNEQEVIREVIAMLQGLHPSSHSDLDCPAEWASIDQLYCNGGCTWDSDHHCGQGDADIFCRLTTCNPASTATSFSIGIASSSPCFSCPISADYANYGWHFPELFHGSSVYLQSGSCVGTHGHGSVVHHISCS